MSWTSDADFKRLLARNPDLAEQFLEDVTTAGLAAVIKLVQTGRAVKKHHTPRGKVEPDAARQLEAEAGRILREAEAVIKAAAAESTHAPEPRRPPRSVRAESEAMLDRMGTIERARNSTLSREQGIAKALTTDDGRRVQKVITDAMRRGEEPEPVKGAATSAAPVQAEALELAKRINAPGLDVSERRRLVTRLEKLVGASTTTFTYPPNESEPSSENTVPETEPLTAAELVRAMETEPDPQKREALMRRLYALGDAV
jgi:hypothetical protein